MASSNSNGKPIPAAGYLRMSSGKQERSPAQQRADCEKLAAKEGCEVVLWFSDEAVTGDSDTTQRSGLRSMLEAAEQGRFKVLLAYHSNRISRADPMDAIADYNRLRKAGTRIVTVSEGEVDLQDFAGQLMAFVRQKGNKDFLIEHSGKVLRGLLDNAKAGGWNGGPVPFAFDRAEFDGSGKFIRRLVGKDRKAADASHRVKLIPCEDEPKLEAARYGFERFGSVSLSVRALSREMNAKGYPSPNGNGWTGQVLTAMLANPIYCGTGRWAATCRGKYHVVEGAEIVAVNGGGNGKPKARAKPREEAMLYEDANPGIIPPKLFEKVQRRLEKRRRRSAPTRRNIRFPGWSSVAHCGEPMHGNVKIRKGGKYRYAKYVCSRYTKWGSDPIRNPTCGHHAVGADVLLRFIVRKLQEVYLGPGREALVEDIKAELRSQTETTSADTERMEKRLVELDTEMGRLVKAIRTTNVPELVEELNATRTESARASRMRYSGRDTSRPWKTSTRKPSG